MLKPRKKNKMC